MPSPSTIAMDSEAAETVVVQVANVIDEILELADDPSVGRLAAMVEFDVQTVPDGTPDSVLRMLEDRDEQIDIGDQISNVLLKAYGIAADALGEQGQISNDLAGALAYLGKKNVELLETKGPELARAAAAFLTARLAYDEMPLTAPESDFETIGGRAADTEAKLTDLLEKAGFLRDGKQTDR